jgi:hypothetical protein
VIDAVLLVMLLVLPQLLLQLFDDSYYYPLLLLYLLAVLNQALSLSIVAARYSAQQQQPYTYYTCHLAVRDTKQSVFVVVALRTTKSDACEYALTGISLHWNIT